MCLFHKQKAAQAYIHNSYYYKRSTSETWKLIGTENTTSAAASFKPTSAGNFDLKIVVTDGDGKSIEKTFALEVK